MSEEVSYKFYIFIVLVERKRCLIFLGEKGIIKEVLEDVMWEAEWVFFFIVESREEG